MFHRTSRFVFPFELTIDIRYLNVFTFCLWMEFGRDARKDNIYIFISRIQWRTRSIFKDKPSFATVDRNLQSLAFHAWNFIFSRVYASAIYIYIYQYFPSRGKYERWNKDPSSKQSSSTESIFQNHFHYSRVSLAVWDANSFWKKKTYYYWRRSVLFPANALLLLLIENVWKRKKKKKKNRKDKFWIARGDGIWYS